MTMLMEHIYIYRTVSAESRTVQIQTSNHKVTLLLLGRADRFSNSCSDVLRGIA
jgi:hypothetical protein